MAKAQRKRKIKKILIDRVAMHQITQIAITIFKNKGRCVDKNKVIVAALETYLIYIGCDPIFKIEDIEEEN